jgi:hypothetical protein
VCVLGDGGNRLRVHPFKGLELLRTVTLVMVCAGEQVGLRDLQHVCVVIKCLCVA